MFFLFNDFMTTIFFEMQIWSIMTLLPYLSLPYQKTTSINSLRQHLLISRYLCFVGWAEIYFSSVSRPIFVCQCKILQKYPVLGINLNLLVRDSTLRSSPGLLLKQFSSMEKLTIFCRIATHAIKMYIFNKYQM